jgi:hypothetical protein
MASSLLVPRQTGEKARTVGDDSRSRSWSRFGRRLTSPAALRLFTVLVGIGSVVFAVMAGVSAGQVRPGFDTIGHVEAPQVVATTDLAFALNDMDANLANILMVGDQTLGPGISGPDFKKLYDADRGAADKDLQTAAAQAGGDESTAIRIRQAMDALSQYEGLAAQVMFLDAQHPGRVPGRTPADEAALFDQAADLMQKTVVPDARAVATDNAAALEASYQSRHSEVATSMVWIGVSGAAVVAVLAVFQVFLYRRTRRLLNPLLAVASVLAIGLTVWAATALSSASEDLRSAKKDAFDSVKALSEAKAVGTAANADESRLLVDPARAAQYQQSFLAETQQLLNVGDGATLASYDASLKAALDAYQADPARHPVTFGGFYGTEMRNITFPGERAAAEKALAAFQTYELDDRVLRQKAQTDLHEAVRFDTSPAAADSDGAFVAYSDALNAVIGINQKAFDQRIASGLGTMDGWPWIPIGGAAVFVVLTVLGVRPRLAEYQ